MTQKTLLISIIGLLLLMSYGCHDAATPKKKTIQIRPQSIDSLIVVSPALNLDLPGRLYYHTGLLAVKKGLVITPTSDGLDTLSFFIDHDVAACCPVIHPIVYKGRGPGELTYIDSNAKSRNGDSLMFFSSIESKFILFDEELELVRENISYENIVIKGSFLFNQNQTFTAQNPRHNDGQIFRISNHVKKESESIIQARVPVGYQPQIRNVVSTVALVPDGIAFSYYGDQEVLFLNRNKIIRALSLGPNEPIDQRKSNPRKDGSSSRAYILKVEYSNDHLFVLHRKNILIFSYPDLLPKRRLVILRDINDKEPLVTGFSVYEDLLYVTHMGEQVSQIKMSPEWFE